MKVCRLRRILVLGPLAGVLCACNARTPPSQSPAARQQEAAEAQRKAASIEAEMNKNADSEDIAKQPGDVRDRPGP
jgi:hypothetical protein